MTCEEYLLSLVETGWFEGMPERLRRATEDRLRADFDPERPWKGLALLLVDPECIYEPGDYTALIEEHATASAGVFAPADISEKWIEPEDREPIISLAMTIAGKRIRTRFRQEA